MKKLLVFAPRFIFVSLFMVFQLLGLAHAFSQPIEMKMVIVEPEWNNKEMCDAGKGIKIDPISSPSLSFIGKLQNESLYDFVYEQRVDNNNWQVIKEGKGVEIVPALTSQKISNSNREGKKLNYQFRLRVTDIANKTNEAISETFNVYVIAPMIITYKSSISATNKQKGSIDINVLGGLDDKKFEWISMDNLGKMSNKKIDFETEDLQNIPIGEYQLTVSDGCSKIVQLIKLENATN